MGLEATDISWDRVISQILVGVVETPGVRNISSCYLHFQCTICTSPATVWHFARKYAINIKNKCSGLAPFSPASTSDSESPETNRIVGLGSVWRYTVFFGGLSQCMFAAVCGPISHCSTMHAEIKIWQQILHL